ncbi:MAG TPA: gamma-glutamyltransferase family protein [Actinomycetota bacterium]|nr:gamma-glutamyltransferase family protein [Actinomycetota bacterium]
MLPADLSEARRFPAGCVATPHHLASAAGLAVLASGGNAVDAAVAANLALGVVAPYLCGFGGDLFALVWRDGLTAYNGSGRAPAAATPDAVRASVGPEVDGMPQRGPHTVTVPGAVDGWFALLERFGSRSFGALARQALDYAEGGFELTRRGAAAIERSKAVLAGFDGWRAVYGDAAPGRVLRQPALARTIRALSDEGPDAYYRGAIASAIAECVTDAGGFLGPADMAEHRGEWVDPLIAPYRDVQIAELPPNTQGVTALEALRIVEAAGSLPPDGPDRQHLLLEAMTLALADRDAYVGDPDHMPVPAETLASGEWAADRARSIGERATEPAPGRAVVGGTGYLCAADSEGTLVSLIQSNYAGFGSGLTVPRWGVNLHNRGTFFSLDPGHPSTVGPRRRPLHTLIPAMALREGRPWLAFGTMGGDGQAQTHVQVLTRVVDDGEDVQRAIDAPRWVVSPRDWSVVADERFEAGWLEALRGRGHRVGVAPWFDPVFGHAHVIEVTRGGYAAASDPRSEGAALGR